ncbi:uncharacterized protein K02A2.6-like [Galendromus occidentalis]|uniref:RNA-directed DNA polymerase n=1 Tax=Galendromus occidentalis TaxID=34638 RepID=A0AAJ7L5Y4_9ACAR|nr:uncharacterized protein K02A2.6-like [Galendromus occidentalis]
MFRRARDTIFWPGLKQDLEEVVSNCTACQTYSIKQQPEPMIMGELPAHPWDIVHQDLMEWSGQQYLATCDGYSNYFDLFKLGTSATTRQVISVTKRLFAAFGRPRQFRTDSDPRYLSGEFREFMSQFRIQHNVSAAHHHQANGRAEAAVKVAKRLVKKSELAREDLELALLEWRNTPQEDGYSPAEKFFCRKTRSLLPVRESDLRQKLPRNVQNSIRQSRIRQKRSFDRGAKVLHPLAEGDGVLVQPIGYGKRWERGSIVQRLNKRTYAIDMENGGLFIRNRVFLRPNGQRSGARKETAENNVLEIITQQEEDEPETIRVPIRISKNTQPLSDEREPELQSTRAPKILEIPRKRKLEVQSTEAKRKDERATPKINRTTRSGREIKAPDRLLDSIMEISTMQLE